MREYTRVETSEEVWIAIKTRHIEQLCVFSSYSDPDGTLFGNPQEAVMETTYGFKGADYPLMEAKTTWDVPSIGDYSRPNETTQYWLCIPTKETED